MSHARRCGLEPDLHDFVVERIADMLITRFPGWSAHTNPGAERNLAVDDCWPDVVLVDDAGAVRAVYEVETADTVDLAHAARKWVAYGRLGKPLYLVVPEERKQAARRLLDQLDLDVRAVLLY